MKKIYNRDLVNSDLILKRKKSWRYCLALLFGMFTFLSFGFSNPILTNKVNAVKAINPVAVLTTCANATVISPGSLPITNQALVCGATNDVTNANSTTCGNGSYKGGLESLYSFTPTTTGSYNIAISGQTYTGIFVTSGCPTSGGVCVGNVTTSGSSKNLSVALTSGIEYFIMFDTWPAPNSPCPGTFSMNLVVPCVTPSASPTDLVFGTTTATGISASFTAASPAPSKYLVVRSTSATAPTPVNGTVYTVGAATLGTGTNVRLASNALTFSDTGLTAETNYYYYVFSYNDACTGAPFYNQTPLNGSQYTRCATGTALAFNTITSSSANLTWSGTGNYVIEYGITGFVPGTGATAGTGGTIASSNATSPFTLTGLAGSTSYSVFVRQICALGGYSPNSSAGVLATACEAVTTFPSVQPFNTYLPTVCWKEGNLGNITAGPTAFGADVSDWGVDGFLNSGTTGAAKMNIDSNTGSEWIISPYYSIPASGYRVKYSVGATQWNATTALTTPWEADDFVQLLVSTSNTNWTVLATYDSNNVPSHLGQIDEVDLSAYSGQTVQFAFLAFEGAVDGLADIDFFFDNFVVEEIPSCLEPTALVSSEITTTTATLSWTDSASSPSNGYDIYYSTVNTAPVLATAPTVDNHTGSTFDASELTSATTYFWWVRSDCGAETSSWASGGSFTTLCNAANVPYFESFESAVVPALPNCTVSQNVGSGNNWKTATAPYVGLSGKVLNYTYNSDFAANAWFYTQGLNLVADTAYTITYNYGNATGATQYPEKMKVAVGTSAVNSAMTTELVDHNNITGGTTLSSSVNYTPSVSGVYYFGFNVYSLADENQLYVDNIKVDFACGSEWLGTVSTDSSNPLNWCGNTLPTSISNVVVNTTNPLIISSEISLASITLGASANVTVNATLNVGNISVASGGTMTVANDAAILQTNGATNTGLVTVKRNSTDLFRQDYTLWSSPVAGQNLRAFSPQTLFNRFSSYDTAAGTIGAYLQEIVTTADMNTKTFTNAKGYLIRMPNNWVEIGGSAQPYLGSFKGTLNNGAVSIPLSGANNKLNLVGNPYASPISIAAFFAANTNIDQTLYFWRKKASATPGNNASGYATYTSLGIVSADASINGTTPTNIEVGQGFFVIANTVTPGNLVFNNTMRNNGAATFYKSSNDNTAELHRFWLNLSNATNVVGQTLIGYKTGATQGIDSGVDALYFNDSATALTSLIDNSEYIIQGRNVPFVDTDIVPLGFKSDVAGSYTIGLSNFDGLFAENQAIYLKDNVSGTLHNLKLSDYTFTTSIGVFNNRFEVQYSSTLGTNNPELAANSILIGVKDQKININAGTITMDKIELIDVAGRVIYTKEGVNATTTTLENVVSSNQMLIVRISTKENGVVIQKIIF